MGGSSGSKPSRGLLTKFAMYLRRLLKATIPLVESEVAYSPAFSLMKSFIRCANAVRRICKNSRYFSVCHRFVSVGTQLLGRAKLPDQLADRLFTVGYRSQAAHLAIRLGYSHGYRLGMDIQTQKS
jgi:hypothetical protein